MEGSRQRTLSHELAATTAINRYRARQDGQDQLFDLGWEGGADLDQRPWITNIHNEDIWLLVRRMDKHIFEMKRTAHVPEGDLDLSVSEDLQCSPNKLRSEVERLYMGLILGLLSTMKAVTRLRSWHEPRRTGMLCTVYFTAWYLDCLLPVVCCLTIAFILDTRIRRFLFPPAPLSMINTKDGGVAKPMAGILGSTDTATGAPQNLRGESIENEASNFVTSFAAIVANLVTGQDPHGAPYDASKGDSGGVIPHVSAGTMAVAKDKAEGMDRPSEDKTKTPMEETIWSHTTPMLHWMIAVSNVWERFANMLVPTPPFDRERHELRLAAYMVPLTLASLCLTRDVVVRATSFAFGVGLFGRPLINKAQAYVMKLDLAWITHHFSLFKGVPNNAQLALTLLRVGEANHAPLPPPVGSHKVPPDEAIDLDESVLGGSLGDEPLGLPEEDLQELADRNKGMTDEAGGANNEMSQATGQDQAHKREKVFNVLKEGARGAVKAVVAVDRLRGKAGAPHAKLRAGALPASSDQRQKSGPVEFSARFDGKKGYVYVDSLAAEPYVAFNRRSADRTSHGGNGEGGVDGPRTLWKIRIDDILRLKKHSGYGLKTKLATGWAVDGGVQDGLRIVDVDENEWIVTALPHRDALFNRLCAIGECAKWEIC